MMEVEFLRDQETSFMGNVTAGQKETVERKLGELLVSRGICKVIEKKTPNKKEKNV